MKETQTKPNRSFFFSTRDLIIMAVMAALGGVASTYINSISDAVHAFLGFPGATQWAAGLHVIWIVLAIGITGKPGTGIITGALKGAVELMSGNSHGIIILLINLVAGLLVDFGFLLFRNKRSLLPHLIAGGLATASNVIVFQIFATLPSNILALSAILILVVAAFISGLIFSGIIPFLLIRSLSKAGVVKAPQQTEKHQKLGWWLVGGVLILAVVLALFLRLNLQGPQAVTITGSVTNAYEFPSSEFTPDRVSRTMNYKGVQTKFDGYPILDMILYAQPFANADTLVIEAADGYAFLVSLEELESNPNILLVQSGKGESASFDVVGPESSKAWVRNVTRLSIIQSQGLILYDQTGEDHIFDPDQWLTDMDSTQVFLPAGGEKLQGVPVWKVTTPIAKGTIVEMTFRNETDEVLLPWSEVAENDDLRIFTIVQGDGLSYALGKMSGEVLVYPLSVIEIR